ncbi:PREDICTED: leukotriene B4 receptor 1 [Bison bison bison]|uniref:Leukotriene B4 receptor 1 n=1 Tax=Bison bison bison TaxID=43346 RepID=A0A6P3GTD8_BISBB|nr:PREDICTED: leukotriene B4 receptor 1 [Bison bison bison]
MNTTSPAAPSSSGVSFISLLVIIVLSVALAVGLPGNSFVVWSILAKLRKRSVTALMVLHLALADLAVLLTAPFFLYSVAQGTWTFGLSSCRLFHYVCGVSMYASVLLIMTMSLDRSLAVALPFVSQKLRTKAVAWRVLAGIWVMSVLLATPVLLYRTVHLGLNNRSLTCFLKYPSERHRAFHLFFEVITGFLLPFLVVVASYCDIGPYHVVNLAEGFRAAAGKALGSGPVGRRLLLARHVLITLAFLSSSVNPLLYACAGGGLLRSAGVGFIAKLLEGTGSETSSSRRKGTLAQTVRGTPASPEPDPAESLTASTNPLE